MVIILYWITFCKDSPCPILLDTRCDSSYNVIAVMDEWPSSNPLNLINQQVYHNHHSPTSRCRPIKANTRHHCRDELGWLMRVWSKSTVKSINLGLKLTQESNSSILWNSLKIESRKNHKSVPLFVCLWHPEKKNNHPRMGLDCKIEIRVWLGFFSSVFV